MRPKAKTILAVCGVLLAIFVIVAAGISLYINSDALRNRLLSAVNDAIDGRLSASEHSISLPAGSMVLKNVVLGDHNGNPIVSIEKLRLSISWLPLAYKTIHCSDLAIEGVRLQLLHDAEDQLNLLQAISTRSANEQRGEADEAQTAWQVVVDRLSLQVAAATYDRPATHLSIAVQQLNTNGSGNLMRKQIRLETVVTRLALKTADLDASIENLQTAAEYVPGAEKPITLTLETNRSKAQLHGDFGWNDPHPMMNASVDLDIDLAQVQPWLPVGLALAGRAKGRLEAKGEIFDPAVEVSLAVSSLAADRFSAQQVSLNAELHERKIDIKRLSLTSDFGKGDLAGKLDLQPLFPESFRNPDGRIDAVGYDLTLVTERLDPKQIPYLQWPANGTYHGTVQLAGHGIALASITGQAQAALTGDGITFDSGTHALPGALVVKLSMRDRKITLEKGSVSIGDNLMALQGILDIGHRQVHMTGRLNAERMDQIGRMAGVSTPEGQAFVRMSCTGSIDRPEIDLSILAQGLALQQWRLGNLSAKATFAPSGRVTLSSLILENGDGRLEGTGRMQLTGADGRFLKDPELVLSVAIKQMSLKDIRDGMPLALTLNGQLDANGTVSHPAAVLTVQPSVLRWQAKEGVLEGNIRWQDGRMEIAPLRMSSGDSTLQLNGDSLFLDQQTNQWTASPRIKAGLDAEALHLKDFFQEMTGRVALHADLEGPVSDLSGTFKIDGQNIVAERQRIETLQIAGRLAQNTFHMDQLVILLAPGQQVTGAGWYAIADNSFQASLKTKGLDISQIEILQQAGSVRGLMDLDLFARGSVAHPHVVGTMAITSAVIADQSWDDFHVRLQLDDRSLEVDADLNFQLSGHCRLDRGDFQVTALFDKTDVSPYLALTAGSHWQGRLSGKVEAGGNWKDPNRLDGAIDLENGVLTYQGVDIVTFEKIIGRMEKGVIQLPDTRLALMEEGYLTVSASGHMRDGISVKADGRYPLAALDPFTDAISEAGGMVQIALKGAGPLNQIKWQGDVVLEGARCRLNDLDQLVHNLDGRFHFDPKRVVVDNLNGMVDDGRFSMDGELDLDAFQPEKVSITFKAQALPFQWPDTMDCRIGADLSLKGDKNKAVLEGRLIFLEGAYYKNLKFNLLSTFTQPQRAAPVPTVRQPAKWMERVELNVTVTHRYPLLVDNNVASLEISPDLKISGTLARPVVSGRAEAKDGEVYFRKKSFAIKRGVVDFINPYKVEPSLDILAETQIRKWQIDLEISGTPDNLLIALSSDPPESDADILSLILLGQTSREFNEEGSGGSGTPANQMLAALIASSFGDEIRKGTGLDILEVETGAVSEDQSSDRIQMTVGKKLSRRLTVKYALESKDEQMVHRAISEYRLLEHFSASGFQDTAGKYGGELVFRIEFR